ncbi:MAG: RNA polymerase sigma-70 factor [Bacteroidia bacterium]|nr:RNA polymerase sigma-70 factor [Bacteroidia bacterium]
MTDTIEHRIILGDEQAFELLYRRYFVRLCAFANKFLNDPQSSEEVVQDIFLKLWENRVTIRSDGSGKSFLFQAVHNKSLNLLAHQKVVNRYSEMIKTVYFHTEEFDAHESLMAKELNLRIQTIINDLAPECKKIFLMSRSEGKKHHEIAEELHISIKTVETQIYRALKKLRTELSDYIVILAIFLFFNI